MPEQTKPRSWSFDPRTDRRERKARTYHSWVAPEHARFAQDMEKKFPVDDLGYRLPGRERELVLDKRPTIMKPTTTPHTIDPNNRLRKQNKY